jgi:hypothetical protein
MGIYGDGNSIGEFFVKRDEEQAGFPVSPLPTLERVELFNTVRGKPTLRAGAFYWVRVVADSEREAMTPETEWQPARYTGQCGDASAAHTWDFIGRASADGHHFVDVMQVGPEIVREPPEPDSDLRERLQQEKLKIEHHDLAATNTGADLDTLAGFYGLTRRGI